MILLIECKIDSETLIDEVIEWRVNSYLFKIYPDENNFLKKITIECKFSNYEDFVPKVTINNGKIDSIEFPKEDFYPFQIEMLQYLESFGALDLGIRKIHWDNPAINWIAENEEERLAIKGYNRKIEYPKNNRKITLKWFQDTLIHRNMVLHLTEPLSYYRIGVNHYHDHYYIQAFLHFYMMIEGVFGNGNTNKKIAIGSFMAAPYLVSAINTSLENFKKSGYEKHKEWFNNYTFLNPKIGEDPVRKMVNILFDERGKLAHNSGINVGRKRNNFEERGYQSLAFTTMMICQFSSIKLRFDKYRQNNK